MASADADDPASKTERADDNGPWQMKATPRTLSKVAELGELLFTPSEVAVALGWSEAELERFLTQKTPRAAFTAGRRRGREALRRAQLKLAQTHTTMAIFVGKTCLGQGEAQEAEPRDEIDASQAGQRVRDKLAAIAAETAAEGDREGE